MAPNFMDALLPDFRVGSAIRLCGSRQGKDTAMPPLLLTPGPLTTSDRTRAALDRDWGSRESDFIALSEGVRARLAALAGVEATHVAVPVQGSGTFAVE